MSTNFKQGDKVRVVKEDSDLGVHGIPLGKIVTLRGESRGEKDHFWSIEEVPGKILAESEITKVCLRCQPGGDLQAECTCNDVKVMDAMVESLQHELKDIKMFFDKGDYLRLATRSEEMSAAATRLANMAFKRFYMKG